jgi:hypothetical protein
MMDAYIAAENARNRHYWPLGTEHLGPGQAPW